MTAESVATLGRRISSQRRAIFLTQEQLAERLAVRQSTIARWETDVMVPALRHRLPLAEALHIAPHILFEGVDEQAAA